MKANQTPSSIMIINAILKPHQDLAADLFALVKSTKSDDPSHRFQIAGITVFMAGIDKVLTVACELACIANMIEWKWLSDRNGKANPANGEIKCDPGFESKINKLCSLKLDIKDLHWMRELRNSYIHGSSINIGYKFYPEPGSMCIKPILEIEFSAPPLISWSANDLNGYGKDFAKKLEQFLDNTVKWQDAWKDLSNKIDKLPINPTGFDKIIDSNNDNEIHIFLEELNNKYIGNCLEKIRNA